MAKISFQNFTIILQSIANHLFKFQSETHLLNPVISLLIIKAEEMTKIQRYNESISIANCCLDCIKQYIKSEQCEWEYLLKVFSHSLIIKFLIFIWLQNQQRNY